MGFIVAGANTTGAKGLSDTLEIVASGQITQLDVKKPSAEPLEIKHISDAGVVCAAKWFGFTDEILPENEVTNELRDVVSYAYFAMREQEDKEMDVKLEVLRTINKENEEEYFPRDLIKFLRASLLGNSIDRRLPRDIDGGDPKKKMDRHLKDGLREEGLSVNRTTPAKEVFRIILEKLRHSNVNSIKWEPPKFN